MPAERVCQNLISSPAVHRVDCKQNEPLEKNDRNFSSERTSAHASTKVINALVAVTECGHLRGCVFNLIFDAEEKEIGLHI